MVHTYIHTYIHMHTSFMVLKMSRAWWYHMLTHSHTYIHTYILTYLHTYIHTYIHILASWYWNCLGAQVIHRRDETFTEAFFQVSVAERSANRRRLFWWQHLEVPEVRMLTWVARNHVKSIYMYIYLAFGSFLTPCAFFLVIIINPPFPMAVS